MRIMRKLLSVAVALSLCASLAAPALAVEYDISNGDIHVENNDNGDAVSWQDNHEEHYSKDTGSKDKEIVVKQEKDEEPAKNTIDVGTDVKVVEITLKDVNIDVSDKNEAAVSVGAGSDVTIGLDGDNSLKSGNGHADLELNNDDAKDRPQTGVEGGSVTIKDGNGIDGSLTAVGGNGAAGIGGGSRDTAGDITIDEADVTATGGSGGAGIGTGRYGETGDITINGSDVTATGGDSSAGIGAGGYGTVGDIDITESDVTAAGGSFGSGIGAGSSSVAGDINITDSDVNATGGYNGAGIGTGFNSTAGDINITESDVNATAGSSAAAGIGTGGSGQVSDITIKGGNIVAKSSAGGGSKAPGIGGYKAGNITLEDLESLIALGKVGYGISSGNITDNVTANQGILNGTFGGNVLSGVKEATIQIMNADGDVVAAIEMGPEEGGMWGGMATLLPEGRYYVYATTDKNPEGVFLAQTYTIGNIAYNVTEGQILSKTLADCATYRVRYAFTSNTEEMELPQGIAELPESILSQKLTMDAFKNGVTSEAEYEDVEVEGGRWHFDGWTPASVLNDAGNMVSVFEDVGGNRWTTFHAVTVVGGWSFVADEPEPVDPVPPIPEEPEVPVIPEEPVVPEEPEEPVIPEEPVAPEVPVIPGDTDDTDAADDGTTIDETAVPLASGPVTRAEFVDYLWRHEGQPAPVADSGLFEDVTEEHTYSPAMAWAKSIGIIKSYEDGTFEPDELVTVSAARGILTRYAAYLGIKMPELTALAGEDDELVLNCDGVISEFFGE